jgi:hypothetical protein
MNSLIKWLKVTNQINNENVDIKPTHLMLNGGKLYIKNENMELFYENYYNSTIVQDEKNYIVECRKDIFILFFDLDFLLNEEKYKKIKENNNKIFIEIFRIINDIIYDFFDKYYECIITTAETKKVKKLCKSEENPENIVQKENFKVGFHLHFPEIITNKKIVMEIRKTCLIRLKKYTEYFENKISDIIDEHVYTGPGLRLTYSKKGHFISQTKEFIDEGRPYTLFLTLRNNEENTDMLNLYQDKKLLIKHTSIITQETDIINIKNNPNLNCEECEEIENENYEYDNKTGSWNRLLKDDVRHIEILRFFNTYVKDYSTKDIKRIFYSDNENVYILCSVSKYCNNIGRNHNSEHIYFKLNSLGIFQRCFCKCDTTDGRKHGYCKDFQTKPIQLTPHLRKVLSFKEISNDNNKIKVINKISSDTNIHLLFDNICEQFYNDFTNKEILPTKHTKRKKSQK